MTLSFSSGLASAEVTCPDSGKFDVYAGVCIPTGTGLSDAKGSSNPIEVVLTNFMKGLLAVVGIIGIIAFAISGIWYLTSAGDDDRMETGKKAMMWSVIGMIIALMGYIIIIAIDTMLRGDSNF